MGRRQWLLFAAAAAILLFGIWRSFQPEAPRDELPEEAPPRYALSGVHWVRLNALGEPEFEVDAASMEYLDDDSIRLRDVQLDTLAGPRGDWHFQAEHGLAPPRQRRVLLFGHVLGNGELRQGTEVRLETSRLWVDQLRRELRTEERVTLHSAGRTAVALGMRSDFNGERLELLRDVQVTYAPDD